jgi:acyl carrier protein
MIPCDGGMLRRVAVDKTRRRKSSRSCKGTWVDTKAETLAVLDEVLGLKGRATRFTDATPLLGAVPELDSMAVVSVLTMLEDRFGFEVDDDEIDGSTFATVGSLVNFVRGKRGE